jgi:hypothetical protein
MTALIVGGNYVGNLKREIITLGHAVVENWSGRKSGSARRPVPDYARIIMVLCDYLNYSLAIGLNRQPRRWPAGFLGEPTLAIESISHRAQEQCNHPGYAW